MKIGYNAHRFCGSEFRQGTAGWPLSCSVTSEAGKTQNWELESSEDSFTLAVVAVCWLEVLQFLSIWVSPCDISKWTSLCFPWVSQQGSREHAFQKREPGWSYPLYDIALKPQNIISFSCSDGQNRHKSTKFKGRKKKTFDGGWGYFWN